MSWADVVEQRRAEQAARLEVVRAWASRLASRLAVEAVVVFGSVARGDFNKWSDIDVLVVAADLPASGRARLDRLLGVDHPPGLQPVAWSPAELRERRRHGDPIAREAEEVGVTVWGRLPA